MSDCVEWQGGTMPTGYGRRYFASSGYGAKDQRVELAHRAAWEEEQGAIPAGMVVHHRCENKLCVNVAHLELLSSQEHSGGKGHGKLTTETVAEVRRHLRIGYQGKDVALMFGISPMLVSHIKRRNIWV